MTYPLAHRGALSATTSAATSATTRTANDAGETGIETTGAAIGIAAETTTATGTDEEATGSETMSAGNGDVTGADRRAARKSARVIGIEIGAATATGIETGRQAETEKGGETANATETGGESEFFSYDYPLRVADKQLPEPVHDRAAKAEGSEARREGCLSPRGRRRACTQTHRADDVLFEQQPVPGPEPDGEVHLAQEDREGQEGGADCRGHCATRGAAQA